MATPEWVHHLTVELPIDFLLDEPFKIGPGRRKYIWSNLSNILFVLTVPEGSSLSDAPHFDFFFGALTRLTAF